MESAVNTDENLNRNISRFFHNKFTVGVFESSKVYTHNFDSNLLLSILGPLGLILILKSIIDLKNKVKIAQLILLIIVLTTPLFALVVRDPKVTFYPYAISLYVFSIRSVNSFSKSPTLKIIISTLLAFSFWYFVFDWQMKPICHEIFFN